MALEFSKYFLQYFFLFLWFSGVNHFVNPSSEAGITVGSGMEPDYQEPLAMEDRHLYMHNRRLSLPPTHADPIQEPLRRHYKYAKLEDFLWTGSGDGPHLSEQDGGLAWEDNGGNPGEESGHHSRSWVKVTRTMTLYRTVLTTIYPVEMTPTVVSGFPIEPTPHLSSPLFSESASVTTSFELDGSMTGPSNTWQVTPTFSPTPEPTQTYQISPSPTSSTTANQSNGVQDNLTAESTDLLYWIQTSIKANDSAFRDAPKVFQNKMQKNLARVYASAFKRHLLTSLGVLPPSKSSSRRKRSSSNDDNHDDNLKRFYVALSSMSPTQLKHLATTTMNVTVSILNVTSEQEPRVDVKYVVLAEGTPVPAFSAVKELDLVSREEMEHEIGYVIINKKAEALVAGPPEQMTRNDEMATSSPWLIVAVTAICLLVILLVLISFMVWKWKHNRLGDSRRLPASISSRPQSGIEIEEGVINPAFLGTPSRIGQGGTREQSPKSSPASSLLTRARTAKRISDILNISSSRLDSGKAEGKKRSRFDVENSPTSSEDLRLQKKPMTSSEGSADWKELLGEPKARGGKGASAASQARARERSPTRQKSSAVGKSERREKDVVRRRRRKSQISKMEEATLKTDDSEMSHSSMDEDDKWEKDQEDSKSVVDSGPLPSRGVTDAISLGNLDICQDTIAKTPSEYAKRMVPWKRPGSAIAGSSAKSKSQIYGVSRPGSRLALPETIEEIPSFDLTEEDEGATAREQDRDLSEKSFEMKDSPHKSTGSPPPDTKDAQVQTPTRISKTASHKARAAPKPRKSWRGSPAGPSESVISTESEEIVEVHHINSSMSDDQNPLGRMRKRFHQFLDDAFNVMGTTNNRKDDPDNQAETQSAKVSISHEIVETETQWRPWTSHVIREETLQKLKRPKSAAVPIGPPKRAWTASSERRTHSAKSKACSEGKSVASTSRVASSADIRDGIRPSRPLPRQQTQNEEEDDSYDKTSTPCTTAREDIRIHTSGGGGANNNGTSSSVINTSDQSQSHSVILSPAFIFPQYPTYPDIRIETGGVGAGSSTSGSNQSSQQQQPPPSLPSNDPAVPLIQAIKNEMKRFEKDPTDPK